MKILLLLLNTHLFYATTAFAELADTVIVNGQSVELEEALNEQSGHLAMVSLKHDSLLPIGKNQLLLPKRTLIRLERTERPHFYRLASFASREKMKAQTWMLDNGKRLFIDCGNNGQSSPIVRFGPQGELLEGCRTAKELSFEQDFIKITALPKSSLQFLPNGKLLHANKTKGHAYINGQKVELLEGHSLHLHENGNLKYLHLKPGSSFTAPTSFGAESLFAQPENAPIIPVFFYEDGGLESGFYAGPPKGLWMVAFGSPARLIVSHAPIGFNKGGVVNKFLIVNNTNFVVGVKTKMQTFSPDLGAVIGGGEVKAGETITLPGNSQVSLSHTDSLTGFPVMGSFSYFKAADLPLLVRLFPPHE